jgi:hypothetical protein
MTRQAVPDDDHILRHVKPSAIDDGQIQGAAFEWRPKKIDDGISVNWIECAEGSNLQEKIDYIRQRRRLQWKKSHRLAKLNVGHTRRTVEVRSIDLGLALSPIVVQDPLEEELDRDYAPDPTHALVMPISLEPAQSRLKSWPQRRWGHVE